MKISATVMAHPKRKAQAEKLHNQLVRQEFYSASITYDKGNSEWATGKRSLLNHSDSDWHVVLQDDAIISPRFRENVVNALKAVPERSLISFYTGRVRPNRHFVKKAVDEAQATNASWLKAITLYWGVGIAVPTEQIAPVLETAEKKNLKYDARIGYYYRKRRLPVYYTYPSIVDHDYKLGSLIGNEYDDEPRRAHKYATTLQKWGTTVVDIAKT